MIAKKAQLASSYVRPFIPFRTAREAFSSILRATTVSGGKVLLPAYIGWSSREGSGVFDPIADLHLEYRFYAVDEQLHVDLDSLRSQFKDGWVRVLLLIHYFGYVDPSYAEAVRIAREFGVFVVEDEAHALLSDTIGGVCGRLGDACIYSFHKILPVESCGAAVINGPDFRWAQTIAADTGIAVPTGQFDVFRIAHRRRDNSLLVDRLIRDLAPDVVPLFGPPACGEFPQTYPVLIRRGSRDKIYHQMNAAGFGVVSLYHTLIPQISPDSFPASTDISRQILNLPVHQDATEQDLRSMVEELAIQVRKQ